MYRFTYQPHVNKFVLETDNITAYLKAHDDYTIYDENTSLLASNEGRTTVPHLHVVGTHISNFEFMEEYAKNPFVEYMPDNGLLTSYVHKYDRELDTFYLTYDVTDSLNYVKVLTKRFAIHERYSFEYQRFQYSIWDTEKLRAMPIMNIKDGVARTTTYFYDSLQEDELQQCIKLFSIVCPRFKELLLTLKF